MPALVKKFTTKYFVSNKKKINKVRNNSIQENYKLDLIKIPNSIKI